MKRLCTLRDALADPNLFATVLPGETWRAWRVLLIAAVGEALTEDERVLFVELTGREREPGDLVEELWALVGRRGGKTRAVAVLACYFAVCFDYSDVLAPGERGTIPIMAATQRQAAKALSYVSGIFAAVPMLRDQVASETAEMVRLTNSIDIEVRPASFRSIRGITAVVAIGDEVAFWRSDESANPDAEILDAVRPSLATTGGPLIVISSVYARKGEAYKTWRKQHGPDGDPLILVMKQPSRVMNPGLPQRVIDRALERDAAVARAEYLSEFRSDVEGYASEEAIEACVTAGCHERGALSGVTYFGFVDPSGGVKDSFTLAIGHREKGVATLDALRERRPPLSPDAVVEEYATLLKSYGIRRVQGDRYAGEWPREAFRKHGVTYEASAKPKSDLYRDLLPGLNSKGVALLDEPRLVAQLVGLERRTARGGRDSIDHAPGAHDDVANAAAGCLVQLLARSKAYGMLDVVGGGDADEAAAFHHTRFQQHLAAFG